MSKPGFVYFVKPIGMTEPIKIGYSLNPVERLNTLMAWAPFHLEVVATAPGEMKDEYRVHCCFADLHSHREWFKAGPRLLEAIQKIAAGASLSEAIDLENPVGRIRNFGKAWSPERRKRVSYGSKLRHRFPYGGPLYEPHDVYKIMSRWERGGQPTVAELARLDEVIANPAKYGATKAEHWAEAAE